jgi:hypothetical protein
MNKTNEGETSSPHYEASGRLLSGGEAEGREIDSGGAPSSGSACVVRGKESRGNVPLEGSSGRLL